jgi:hypothetical protein
MPVPAWCHGIVRSRPTAAAAFRRARERLHQETTSRQWQDAFTTQKTGEERLDEQQRPDRQR